MLLKKSISLLLEHQVSPWVDRTCRCNSTWNGISLALATTTSYTIVHYNWVGRTPCRNSPTCLWIIHHSPSLLIDSTTNSAQRSTFLKMQWWYFQLLRVDSQSNRILVVVSKCRHILCQSFLQYSVCPDSFSLWRGWFYRGGVSWRILWMSKRITWESC